MVGGADTAFGTFHCEGCSVVNRAQTVGAIGKQGGGNAAKILVPVRVISLEQGDAGFGENVTKTNDCQNRIENRDFVSLDPEQSRIRTELAIDKIDYQLARSESVLTSLRARRRLHVHPATSTWSFNSREKLENFGKTSRRLHIRNFLTDPSAGCKSGGLSKRKERSTHH